MKGLIAQKVGMTRLFDKNGKVTPITVLKAGPNVVLNKRTIENNRYEALQLGFIKQEKENRVTKPMKGYFKANGTDAYRFIKEFSFSDNDQYEKGQELNVDIFEDGELVDVQGTSIGKGFQGVVKRYNFAGGRASHGSTTHRAPGSIGMCEFPGRVIKGKKMPGRMGGKTVTVQRLKVVEVRPEENLILVKGSVPGHKNSIVYIKNTAKPKI